MMNPEEKLNLVRQWNALDGDNTLRVTYPLSSESAVIDLGAYVGDWTAKIHQRYGCRVWAYEPIPLVALKLLDRFSGVREVHVMPYGVYDSDGTANIGYAGGHSDASSLFTSGDETYTVMFRDVLKILDDAGLEEADLIKINTEGSEYAILERLILSGMISKFRNIQVQFHDFLNNADERREHIRNRLSMTHKETYCIPFVWESWSAK